MSPDGPVVLIVDRDPVTRDRVGAWLEDAGLDVLGCPGPTGPKFTCVGSRDGRCPLAQAADVVVLNPWLESDAAMLGTRASKLVRHYRAWGKPVVMMTGRRDDMTEQIVSLSSATVDWPPDHRDLIETIRVIRKDMFAGGATITTTNGRSTEPQHRGPEMSASRAPFRGPGRRRTSEVQGR